MIKCFNNLYELCVGRGIQVNFLLCNIYVDFLFCIDWPSVFFVFVFKSMHDDAVVHLVIELNRMPLDATDARRCDVWPLVFGQASVDGFNHLRFYRWGTNCCRCHFVVVPIVIWVTMVESQGIRKSVPNSDDPYDPCAYIIPLRPHPISLRQIRAMWWTTVLRLLAIERLVMPRTRCYSPDLKQCPKRWM